MRDTLKSVPKTMETFFFVFGFLRFASRKIPDITSLKTSIIIRPLNLKLVSIPGSSTRIKKITSSEALTIRRFIVHSFFAELLASSKIINPISKMIRTDKSKTVIFVTSFLVVEMTI